MRLFRTDEALLIQHVENALGERIRLLARGRIDEQRGLPGNLTWGDGTLDVPQDPQDGVLQEPSALADEKPRYWVKSHGCPLCDL